MLDSFRIGHAGRATAAAFALWAVLPSIACGQGQGTSQELHKSLVGILERQAAEWNQGDLEKFMDAYWRSEQLTFSSGGKTTRGWNATLDRYRERYADKAAMGQLTFSELEVTPLGSEAALMLGRWHLVAHGEDYEGNFSLVWRQIDGQWKIIHDHSSAVEPAKSIP